MMTAAKRALELDLVIPPIASNHFSVVDASLQSYSEPMEVIVRELSDVKLPELIKTSNFVLPPRRDAWEASLDLFLANRSLTLISSAIIL